MSNEMTTQMTSFAIQQRHAISSFGILKIFWGRDVGDIDVG